MPINTEPKRAVRRWLIAVLAVVAGLGVIATLGGFGVRKVTAVSAQPGTEIDAGNLLLRLDSATLQYLAKNRREPWKVVVSGTVRNPHHETLDILSGSRGNLVAFQDGAEPSPSGDFTARYGPQNPDVTVGGRRVVPPTNEWMTFTATFRYEKFPDSDRLEVVVVPMEFTVNTILGLSDVPTWNVDSYALPTSVVLPLTRIADGDY